MEQKRFIFLIILAVLLASVGIVTMQLMLTFMILVIAIFGLLIMDGKKWVEAQVEKIAAGIHISRPETSVNGDSVAALKADIARIELRLDALERRKND
ncbi:MAG: hypothetical protein M0R30_09500 [Methanoregula sp.]|uniref:hypothetical protein n=1 Tax=Methanoregula sp. TaxID=2052170 RepID=UPI0025F99728|nr:hypothetical protein [Methanoregula sp.]MCK9631866.1 hypothetical protein [Methanoregula sp.]